MSTNVPYWIGLDTNGKPMYAFAPLGLPNVAFYPTVYCYDCSGTMSMTIADGNFTTSLGPASLYVNPATGQGTATNSSGTVSMYATDLITFVVPSWGVTGKWDDYMKHMNWDNNTTWMQ